jgi:hypothetical protein
MDHGYYPYGALMRPSGDLLPMMLPVGYTFVGEKNHRYRETSTILFVFLYLNSFPPSATLPLPLSRDDPEPILIRSQTTRTGYGIPPATGSMSSFTVRKRLHRGTLFHPL